MGIFNRPLTVWCYRRAWKTKRGREKASGRVTVEIRHEADGASQRVRVPGFTDLEAARAFRRNLLRLASCRGAGQSLDADLTVWLSRLSPDVLSILRALPGELIDAGHVAAGKRLDQHLEDYEAVLNARGDTAAHVEKTASRIRAVLAGCSFRYAADVTPAKLENYLALLRAKGLAIRTSNGYLTAFKGFMAWLVAEGRLLRSPVAHVKGLNPRVDVRRVRRAMSAEECKALLCDAEASAATFYGMTGYDRAMMYQLALGSGLRWSELRSLTRGSLDLDGDRPTVTVAAGYSKHKREDVQPIPPSLAATLTAYMERRPATGPALPMPVSDQGAAILRADLRSARARWLWDGQTRSERRRRRATEFLSETDAAGRVLDFHSLRHSYISHLAAGGVHPATAQRLARHSTISLTMDKYTHMSAFDQAAALDALPDLAEPEEAHVARATGTDDGRVLDMRGGKITDNKLRVAAGKHGKTWDNLGNSTRAEMGTSDDAQTQERQGKACVFAGQEHGGPSRTRTCDQGIMSPLLCH